MIDRGLNLVVLAQTCIALVVLVVYVSVGVAFGCTPLLIGAQMLNMYNFQQRMSRLPQ